MPELADVTARGVAPRKRPELGGRNTNSSNHSMNSLRSDSISYFVSQIAFRNQRLNIDSKNLHSSKDLLVRNVFRITSFFL